LLSFVLVVGEARATPDEERLDTFEQRPSSLDPPPPTSDHRTASALGLASAYISLGTWTWFAWYANQPRLPTYRVGGDGWFGETTYAGGADKFGHFWANLALSRLGTELLRSGGWSHLASNLMASGICLAAFTFIEVNDGYYTEFSLSDMSANILGGLTAVAMNTWPKLDEAIDFRVQWYPSPEFRRNPAANFAEDYSGQTYLLAFKPRALDAIRENEGALNWLQFVNPVIAFESRNYKPEPPPDSIKLRKQNIFIGVTLDIQACIDEMFIEHRSRLKRWSYRAGHGLFEVVNLPFSTLPIRQMQRSAISRQ
jgi:hypothetical protein